MIMAKILTTLYQVWYVLDRFSTHMDRVLIKGVVILLTERQKKILAAIVDDYIQSAEPVGSRTISKRMEIGFSSATIRNEMSDLEELGYLEQPHTSAGRIPSNRGYRFYVDHLLNPQALSADEIVKIKHFFDQKFSEVEQVTQQVAVALSQLTNYTSIVMEPEAFQSRLKQIQIIPLNSHSVVAIVVTDNGRVENKTITIPEEVSVHDMEKLVNILNARLQGIPMSEVRRCIYKEIAQELRRHLEAYDTAMEIIMNAFLAKKDERIYLKGATNIMSQPEFRDIDKAKDVLNLLEQNEAVIRLFGMPETGVKVRIGHELDEEAVNNCSIVVASYGLNGQPIGTIGILGPTRMEYAKIIGILNHLVNNLPVVLNRFYDEK